MKGTLYLQDKFGKRQDSELTMVRERKDPQATDNHEALSVPGEGVATMVVADGHVMSCWPITKADKLCLKRVLHALKRTYPKGS